MFVPTNLSTIVGFERYLLKIHDIIKLPLYNFIFLHLLGHLQFLSLTRPEQNGFPKMRQKCEKSLPVLMLRDAPDPMKSEVRETCAELVSTVADIVPLSTE